MWGAIEAGGTKFICAAGASPEEILDIKVIPTTTPEETFSAAAAYFVEAGKKFGALEGLGVASFGPIDIDPRSASYGRIRETPKPGWCGASYVDELNSLGAPIIVDTDVNGAALGEWIAGAGRGASTLAYVTAGTGIGVGVLRNGTPFSGFTHFEMGHIRPPRDETVDSFAGICRFHGNCLEGLASGPAIKARWGMDLSDLGPNHCALDLEAHYLAHLALTLICAHMPDRIIFGGGVMQANGLIEKLRAKTQGLLGGYLPDGPASGDLDDYIVEPALSGRSGVVGALRLAQMARGTAPNE